MFKRQKKYRQSEKHGKSKYKGEKFLTFSGLVCLLTGLGLALYLVSPYITFWVKQRTDSTQGYAYDSPEARKKGLQLPAPPTDANYLVIPKINIKEKILEDKSNNALNLGVWRKPNSSRPGESGNIVLTGHRFYYNKNLSQPPFFHLDKLQTGDEVIVFWNGKAISYRIDSSSTVTPDTVQIEQNRGREELTIYTCTPLWSASHRLVFTALPVDSEI